MADCNETLHELYTFLDDEVGPVLRAQIQDHLSGCMDCLQVFDFHAELRTVIAQKCHEDVPAGLADRIVSCFGEDALPDPPPDGESAPA